MWFQLYDQLKTEQPDVLEKLQAITGDVDQEDLGMRTSDRELLENCIHVVFHSAATVKFDEPLR